MFLLPLPWGVPKPKASRSLLTQQPLAPPPFSPTQVISKPLFQLHPTPHPPLLTAWNVSSDCESLVRALLLTHSCSPSLVQVRIPSHLDYSGPLIDPPSGSFLNGGQTVFTCVSHTVLRALIDHRWCGSSLRSKHLSFSKLSVTLVGWTAHPMPSNLFCTHLKIQPPL